MKKVKQLRIQSYRTSECLLHGNTMFLNKMDLFSIKSTHPKGTFSYDDAWMNYNMAFHFLIIFQIKVIYLKFIKKLLTAEQAIKND